MKSIIKKVLNRIKFKGHINVEAMQNEIRKFFPAIEKDDLKMALIRSSEIDDKIIGRYAAEIQDRVTAYCSVIHHVKQHNPSVMTNIEIGTLFGGSCIMQLLAMRDVGVQGRIICVDPMDGYYDKGIDPISGEKVCTDSFFENIRLFGFTEDDVDLRKHFSTNPKSWENISECSILMIDGDHSYKGVCNDWNNFSKFVTGAGGLVLFDDYGHPAWPEVKQAANDIINKLDASWTLIGTIGTTLMLTHQLA